MPDLREFFDIPEENMRALWLGIQKHLNTALPCIVTEDSDGHTVCLQIAIKRAINDRTYDATTYENFPPLVDVPVHFPSGGGVTLTHPIRKNDEGLAIFASRSIDAWHQSGGVQQPIFNRYHSLADAFFIPGVRSTPRKLSPAPSTTSAQMRSDDGQHIVDLHPTNGVTLKSRMAVTLHAPTLTHIGDLTIMPDPDTGSGGNLTVMKVGTSGGAIIADTVTAPHGAIG